MRNTTKILLSLTFLSFICGTVHSQSKSLRVGMEVPLQLAIGFENQFHEWFSFHGQLGLLTVPLNLPLMAELRMMGFSSEATDILETVLDFGTIAGGGFRYYFNKHTLKNYCGPYFLYINSYKSAVTDVSVSTYFNQDMNTFPLGPKPKSLSEEPLTLSSKFIQVGFQYGYRIRLPRDDRELRVEFNISKNLWSKHVIESDYRFLGDFKKVVSDDFQNLFKQKGFISTINLYYIIKTEYKRF